MNVDAILLVLFLTAIVEGFVEWFIKPFVQPGIRHFLDPAQTEPEPAAPPAIVLRYAALALGVGLAVIFQADLIAVMRLTPEPTVAGMIITGMAIGRGSNYLNDLIDRWL